MTSASLPAPTGDLIVPAAPTADGSSVWFSLVVPTYNESKNMETLVTQVTSHLEPAFAGRYEMIIVDDNSPDGTADLALQLAERFPQLRVMKRVGERGLSTAVIRGWQGARGEVLGVMDGDLQHPTSVLVDLLHAAEAGADVAVASRYVPSGSVGEWGLLRRIMSRGAGSLAGVMLPEAVHNVSDPMSGYFVVRRDVIAGVELKPKGYKILLELLARTLPGKVVEVPFEFALRQHGETKATWRQFTEYLSQLMELRMHLWSSPRKSR
jgi:dolichol-phosphate mannosyltransferase